ncbi:MAG: hypothetical protein NUV84_03555 [Candidatus Uhrbacteria bacterium]|nr:hypothetical protein [Candidatus Uhrbacteria bacterium]
MKVSKKKVSIQSAAEEFFYFGVGLASLAKDQLESLSKKDLSAKGRSLYKKMQSEMQEMNATLLKKMNIPSRKEFEALKRQVGNKRSKK